MTAWSINEETKQRFDGWWKAEKADRPMLRILARGEEAARAAVRDTSRFLETKRDIWLKPEYRFYELENFLTRTRYLAEAFPCADSVLGPGAMAAYLACEPVFFEDTIWYRECGETEIGKIRLGDYCTSRWWREHLDSVEKLVALVNGKYPVAIPDIGTDTDILSAIRGPQQLCLDLMDSPCEVKRLQGEIAQSFPYFYNAMYDRVKNPAGESVFTAFYIWGRGKTGVVQCDFSCLIGEGQFREFIMPEIRRHAESIPYALYHLDGKGAIRHLPEILSVGALKAVQWEPGAGETDGGDEKWYPVYDKVMDAGKALWLSFRDGGAEELAARSAKIAKRYGNKGLYFVYPAVMSGGDAETIMRAFR